MLSVNIVEIFNRAMKDKGKYISTNDLPSPMNQLLIHYQNRCEHLLKFDKKRLPLMPNVHFGYLDNYGLNAVAFIEDDHWFIGMNLGTILVIFSWFQRMLADPEILPSIGNIKNEERQSPTEIYWNTDFFELVKHNSSNLKAPKDETRQNYAQLLTDIAIDFLFHHEFTHLAHGHVSWLGKTENLPYISEFETADNNSQNLSNAYKITRQMLEYDADSGAVSRAWEELSYRVNNKLELPKEYRPFYETLYDAIYTWEFSISSLFLLFDTKPINANTLYNFYHPQVTIRSFSISATMLEHLIRNNLFEEELYKEMSGEVLTDLRVSFEKITSFNAEEEYQLNLYKISQPRNVYYEERIKYEETIFARWKTLRPELMPLAHGIKLAP
jgi:hypothetical protein